MYEIDKTNNANFSLIYHFISVIKYRQNVFTEDSIISDLKTMVDNISKDFDVNVIEQECGVDHLHLLFRCKPTLDITKFINVLKGQTARELRKNIKTSSKINYGEKVFGHHHILLQLLEMLQSTY